MIGACHCSGRRATLRDLPSAGLYPSRVLLVSSWSRFWNNENESKGVLNFRTLETKHISSKSNNSFKFFYFISSIQFFSVKIFSFLFLKRVFKFSHSISLICISNFIDLSILELFKEKSDIHPRWWKLFFHGIEGAESLDRSQEWKWEGMEKRWSRKLRK